MPLTATPRLNQAAGLDTGFPLIGYRSVAQDVVLMIDNAIEIASLTTEGEASDPDTAELLLTLSEALSDAASAIRTAVTTPDCDATEDARAAFEVVDEYIDAMNNYLADGRPEPLLEPQRSVVLLERSARHARNILSVATHLAFRDDPTLVSGGEPRDLISCHCACDTVK